MTRDEFYAAYAKATEDAKRKYSSTSHGQTITSNGMDKDLLDYIMSPSHLSNEGEDELVASIAADLKSDYQH